MTVYRAKGHFKDKPDNRDLRVADLVGAVNAQANDMPVPVWGAEAASVDLTQFVGDMWDQGSAEGCVGYALARATHMRGLIQGFANMEAPSPYAIWALARMRAKQLTQPLQNEGCQPRDACEMIRTWGLAPWSAWPSEFRFANTAPTPDMLSAASSYRAASYYSLDNASDRVSTLKQALTAQVPVNLAVMVDNTFNDYNGSYAMPNFDGNYLGSHYITLIGYNARDEWLICNSWGTQWGFGGFGWLTTERILHPTTTDLRAALVVPDMEGT